MLKGTVAFPAVSNIGNLAWWADCNSGAKVLDGGVTGVWVQWRIRRQNRNSPKPNKRSKKRAVYPKSGAYFLGWRFDLPTMRSFYETINLTQAL